MLGIRHKHAQAPQEYQANLSMKSIKKHSKQKTKQAWQANTHKLGEKTQQAWQANIYIETKHKHGKQAQTQAWKTITQPWQANTTRLASGDKDDKQTQAWQTNKIIAINYKNKQTLKVNTASIASNQIRNWKPLA